MAKGSGNTRNSFSDKRANSVAARDYHAEAVRFRADVLKDADKLKGNPLSFSFNNGISGQMEITKSDMKTLVSKNTADNKFNAFKNLLAKDIKGFVEKATYEGWRETLQGKHSETAYFVYYSREWGAKAYLCVRRMKGTGLYKPYAIINEQMFSHDVGDLHKGKPPL